MESDGKPIDSLKEHSDPAAPDANAAEDGTTKRSWFFGKKKPADDQKKEAPKERKVSILQLFRYTNHQEKIYLVISIVAAILHGALLPLFTIFFGGVINSFGEVDSVTETVKELANNSKYFLILAAVAFVTSLIQVRFQLIVAQRLCARLRSMYFESLMSQDFTWYNANDGGELTTRVANDVNIIQAGVGDKVTAAFQFLATFVVGIVIAFAYNALLTLVIFAVAPLLMIGGAIFAKLATDSSGDGLGAYGAAGGVASEVIGLIRVVTAYNGQKSETERYSKELDRAYKANVKKHFISGFFLGFTMFVIFCSYAIAFAFGAFQVREGNTNAGDIVTTFFSVIIACFSLGQGKSFFFEPLTPSVTHISHSCTHQTQLTELYAQPFTFS